MMLKKLSFRVEMMMMMMIMTVMVVMMKMILKVVMSMLMMLIMVVMAMMPTPLYQQQQLQEQCCQKHINVCVAALLL